MTQRSDQNPDRRPFGPEEREIMALQHAWMKAVMAHDAPALQQILADDFTLTSVHSSGELVNKAEYIGSFGKVKNSLFSFRDVVIRIYGEMAVVNSRFHQQYAGDSKESAGEFLMTDVWVKRDGRWQAVSRHASRPALTIERASAVTTHEAE